MDFRFSILDFPLKSWLARAVLSVSILAPSIVSGQHPAKIPFPYRPVGRNNIKDVTILQMGGLAEAMAGLSKGSVDGAVVSPPHTLTLLKQGFRELVSPGDLRKLGIGFVTNGIVARRSFASSNRNIVLRVIKATAEGTKLMTANEPLTKKLISKYLHIDDPELLHQSYLYVSENFAREPFVPPGAMQWMAQQLAQMNLVDAKALQTTPNSAFFDNSFVEELKHSGFFESLWK